MNRRSFIGWCALTLGGSLFGIAAPESKAAFAATVRGLFYAPDDAATVGRRYLVLHPDEANREMLMRQLGIPDDLSCSKARLADMINRQRAQDYHDGRMVVVDGWILARSEAAVCALVALT